MGWGTRLIPVDELERFVATRRRKHQAEPGSHARSGRKTSLSPEVVARISTEYNAGESFGEIARNLNSEGVRTSQGGRHLRYGPFSSARVRLRPAEPALCARDCAHASRCAARQQQRG